MRPEAEVCVVRELSKKFQQVMKMKAANWPRKKADMTFKGEFVFLFHNSEMNGQSNVELKELAQEIVAEGAAPKKIAKLLGLILDRPTKEIYSELSRQKRIEED